MFKVGAAFPGSLVGSLSVHSEVGLASMQIMLLDPYF